MAGLHINMCSGAAPAGSDPNAGLSDAEVARLKVRQAFQAEETGLPADSGDEATDAWLRVERLAGRSGGVDCREIPHVVRL